MTVWRATHDPSALSVRLPTDIAVGIDAARQLRGVRTDVYDAQIRGEDGTGPGGGGGGGGGWGGADAPSTVEAGMAHAALVASLASMRVPFEPSQMTWSVRSEALRLSIAAVALARAAYANRRLMLVSSDDDAWSACEGGVAARLGLQYCGVFATALLDDTLTKQWNDGARRAIEAFATEWERRAEGCSH